tara:strand:- start:858 stop:1322 length:465 start_codon:yes stop_codon:yes gene_type:complete
MPYTVTFLDDKLYQSLSFDADIKFPEASLYAKKIWALREYKKQGGEVKVSEETKDEEAKLSHSSYSLKKSFKNDELVVELIQSFTVSETFNFFSKAALEKETGDEELDEILLKISESDFDESVIKAFILDSLLQGEYPQKPEDSEASEEESETE